MLEDALEEHSKVRRVVREFELGIHDFHRSQDLLVLFIRVVIGSRHVAALQCPRLPETVLGEVPQAFEGEMELVQVEMNQGVGVVDELREHADDVAIFVEVIVPVQSSELAKRVIREVQRSDLALSVYAP